MGISLRFFRTLLKLLERQVGGSNQRGVSLLQSLIGGSIVIGVGYMITQQVLTSLRVQRQSELRNTRNQIVHYYSEVVIGPLAKPKVVLVKKRIWQQNWSWWCWVYSPNKRESYLCTR